MMLRRRIFDKGIQKYGTADYSIIDKQITGKEKETLPFNLLDGNMQAFSILFKYKILSGYAEGANNINLDFISCGEQAGNFSNAIRIGRFSDYAYNRLSNTGKYISINSENKFDYVIGGMIAIVETTTVNLTTLLNSNTASSNSANYVVSNTNVDIGGTNGGTSPSSLSVGIIEQVHFYFKALTSTDLVNWFENGIIP